MTSIACTLGSAHIRLGDTWNSLEPLHIHGTPLPSLVAFASSLWAVLSALGHDECHTCFESTSILDVTYYLWYIGK